MDKFLSLALIVVAAVILMAHGGEGGSFLFLNVYKNWCNYLFYSDSQM